MPQLYQPNGHLLHIIDSFITDSIQALAARYAHLLFTSRHINLVLVGLISGLFPVGSALPRDLRKGCAGGDGIKDAITCWVCA